MASKWGRRGADAAYGIYSGSGEMDGNSALGGVAGGVSNSVFGSLGRAGQRGLGGMFTGVRNPSLAYLNDANVPLSIGRIARGSPSNSPRCRSMPKRCTWWTARYGPRLV